MLQNETHPRHNPGWDVTRSMFQLIHEAMKAQHVLFLRALLGGHLGNTKVLSGEGVSAQEPFNIKMCTHTHTHNFGCKFGKFGN